MGRVLLLFVGVKLSARVRQGLMPLRLLPHRFVLLLPLLCLCFAADGRVILWICGLRKLGRLADTTVQVQCGVL